ncbi:MAG: SDR family NAD(P)-dependent oxidoreductase [Acidimicrobiales bacterium]
MPTDDHPGTDLPGTDRGASRGASRGGSPRSGLARLAAGVLDSALEATVLASFSAVGYRARQRIWDWPAVPAGSMDGQVAMVTGATSGIGQVVAVSLAGAGATVIVCGRAPDKVASMVAGITGTGGRALGEVADLSSLQAAREMARRAAAAHARLDVLVHCAGGLHRSRQSSADGYELTVATQVLAPFVITDQLRAVLGSAAPSRVITVSSGGAYASRLSVEALEDPPEPYRGARVYSQVKRAQIVLAGEWGRRLAPDGVAVHVMHPGWVDTPGLVAGMPKFHKVMGPLLRSPEEGADTVTWLASAAPGLLGTGQLWLDRRKRSPYHVPGTREPPAEREALWAWCERATASRAQ